MKPFAAVLFQGNPQYAAATYLFATVEEAKKYIEQYAFPRNPSGYTGGGVFELRLSSVPPVPKMEWTSFECRGEEKKA